MTILNDPNNGATGSTDIIIDSSADCTLPIISSLDLNTIDLTTYSTWNTTMNNTGAIGSNTLPSGNITISNTTGNYQWSTLSPTFYTTAGANGTSGLHVSTDATFEGDIKWKGKSLGEMIEKIHDRLAILTPDMEKLEHFAALKKAYDNYKMLEALCEVPKKEEDEQ